MATRTLPAIAPSCQEMASRYYGSLSIWPREDERPAVIFFTFHPAETILTGFQDALNVVGRNYPTFTVLGTVSHACRHSTMVFADGSEAHAYCADILLWEMSRTCPVCLPLPVIRVPLLNEGDSVV